MSTLLGQLFGFSALTDPTKECKALAEATMKCTVEALVFVVDSVLAEGDSL